MGYTFDSDEHIGEKYGELTLVKYVGRERREDKKRSRFQQIFLCKCDCGNTRQTTLEHLKSGKTKACGKCKIEKWLGRRYGDLVVTEIIEKARRDEFGKHHSMRVKVHCDCGSELVVFASALSNKRHPKRDCGICRKKKCS